MDTYIFALAAIFLLLALHPFITYPLSLAVLALGTEKGPTTVADGRHLSFAICTCAYNEEAVIEGKLRNLLDIKSRHPTLEVLIYVDAASDETASICERFSSQIRLIVSPQRHGKTFGMNLLVQHTDADILVFTDANVTLDLDVVERLQLHFADPAVGCVCGNLTYINAQETPTAHSGSLYWRIEEAVKRLEMATGTVIGADGSLFAMRRSLHTSPPDDIIDDFYHSLNVVCQGKRVIQARDVGAFEKSVPVPAEEFARKVRISCQAFNVHRLLWRQITKLEPLDLYKYISHKFLRWTSIFSLTAAYAFLMAGAVVNGWWFAALGLLCAPAALWIFGSRWSVRPVAQIYDIVSAFVATGIGVIRSLRGERFQTWAPAASLRR